MNRGRVFRIACLVVFAAALVSCLNGCASGDPYFMNTRSRANVHILPQPVAVEKIAVLPFRAPTELIGSSVSDMFVTEILRARRYEVVERSQMASVLSEAELAMAGLSSARAAEVGNMMGADGVIIGTVDEYGTVAHRGRTYPVVGLSVRMIECSSGKVMWSADLAKRSDDRNAVLSAHAREVVHEIMAGIYQKWRCQRVIPRRDAVASRSDSPSAPVSRSRPDDVVGMVDEEPPPVPSDFTLSDMGLREVTVKWSDSAGSPAVYRIERASSAEGPFTEVARVPYRRKEYTDRGSRGAPLQDSTVYYYRLTALTERGAASNPSRVRESMTASPPEPPAKVAAEASASRAVRLNWEPSASEGVTRYIVERIKAGDQNTLKKVGEVEDATFFDGGTARTDLECSTEYLYRVTAINRVGSVGSPSKAVRVKTQPPPAPVEGVAAGSREVRCVPLSWDVHPQDDIVGYIVYRSDAADGEFAKIADVKGRENTRYLDGGRDPGNLLDDSTYYYLVSAVNHIGVEGDDSKVFSAATRPPPPMVTELTGESFRPCEVPLKWNMSGDEKVIGYAIARAEPDSDHFIEIAQVQGREAAEYLDRGQKSTWFGRGSSGLGDLASGTEYRYRVCAFNTAQARSEWSEPVAVTTKFVPEIPKGLATTTNQPRQVQMGWDENPESDIREYVIESSSDGRRFRDLARVAAETGELIATDGQLADNERRWYRVKAIDADTLESEWCEAVEGRAKPVPDAPSDMDFEFNDDGAVVRWSAPVQPDITGYKVWKKGLLNAQELGAVEATEFAIEAAVLGKGITIQVSALDADGLESARTAPLEIRPAR